MQSNSELFDVIHFEAPQIKKFYEDFLHSAHKTPKKPSLLLKILASPLDIPARRLLREDPMDLFNELLEQDSRNKSPFALRTPSFLNHCGYFLNNFSHLSSKPALVAENVSKIREHSEKLEETARNVSEKPKPCENLKEKG